MNRGRMNGKRNGKRTRTKSPTAKATLRQEVREALAEPVGAVRVVQDPATPGGFRLEPLPPAVQP